MCDCSNNKCAQHICVCYNRIAAGNLEVTHELPQAILGIQRYANGPQAHCVGQYCAAILTAQAFCKCPSILQNKAI